MDRVTERIAKMLYEQPYDMWPKFSKAMGWERGRDPEWMTPDERVWFWRTVDYETAKAEKQAAEDKAWADLKAALIAPFAPVVEWLAKRLPK
jgi:hypothetical protein